MKFEEETITSALQMALFQLGIDGFSDMTRINAFLMDVIPQYPKERKLIISAINLGIGDELKKGLNNSEIEYKLCQNRCVKNLTDNLFITADAAHFAVSVIANSIGSHFNVKVPDLVNGAEPKNRELLKGATDKLGSELTKLLSNYETIGYKAFAANLNLTELEIPLEIHSIKSKAFVNCLNLRRIILHKGISVLGDELFSGCDALSNIEISGNPSYMIRDGMLVDYRNGALMRATNTVDNVCVIPDKVVVVKASCFERSSIKEIILSPNTAVISSKAFIGCEKLQRFKSNRLSQSSSIVKKHFSVSDGILYNGDMTILVRFPSGYEESSYIVEDSVNHIADGAFSGAVNLNSITFTSGLRTIGRKAFEHCGNITSLLLPKGIISIEERAFQYCTGLSSVMLPQSIETIGDFTFYGCSSVETISVPKYVKSIGHAAFMNCSHLGSVVIQENVRFIGDRAFEGCSEKLKVLIRNNDYVARYCDAHNINWDTV